MPRVAVACGVCVLTASLVLGVGSCGVAPRTEAAAKAVALPEVRTVMPLADGWSFHKGPLEVTAATGDKAPEGSWEQVSVPHTWNALDGQDGGDNYYMGDGWYRRTLVIPPKLEGKRLYVRFEAVDRAADVYMNGKELTTHVGGNSAFVVEITDSVRPGENLLAVRATNADDHRKSPPISADYTFFGGIYRPVELVATDALHITMTDYASPGVYVATEGLSDKDARLSVRTSVLNEGTARREADVRVQLVDVRGMVAAENESHLVAEPGKAQPVAMDLHVTNPRLWNGRIDPYLYTVRVALETAGPGAVVTDSVSQRFGIRSFAVDPSRGFLLNGKPYALHGVNRHQDRQDKGWALSKADHEQDMALIEEMGCTAIRLAHYQHADYFYELCDRAGMVVWAEIPNVNYLGASADYTENAKQQFRELIRQNFNHASIAFWSSGNEVRKPRRTDAWAEPNDPEAATWFRMMSDLAQQEDPHRLSAVACRRDTPYPFAADVYGLNIYYGWYEGSFEAIDSYFSKIPPRWALTEYGAGASIYFHAETPQLRDHTEEYANLFHERNWAAIKKHPEIWGTYVWNMFDFAVDDRFEGDRAGINDKGLVTYDRKVKKDAFYFYKANWSQEPTVYITSRRFAVRGVEKIPVKVYSNGAKVALSVNGKGLGEKDGENGVVLWEQVALKEGPNVVVASARFPDGKIQSDEVTFTYKKGAPTEVYVPQDDVMRAVYKDRPPRHNYPKKPATTRPVNPSIMQ